MSALIMKTPAIVLAAIGALTAPALAGSKRVEIKTQTKPNFGESYDLPRLDRRAKLPTETEKAAAAKSLSQVQVGEVVKQRRDDVEYCWASLAITERMPCTAVLKLSIDPQGNVLRAKVGGDAPASVSRCLGDAATHWTFPTAEVKSDVQYPISLRTL
jgi:hypothetical protein